MMLTEAAEQHKIKHNIVGSNFLFIVYNLCIGYIDATLYRAWQNHQYIIFIFIFLYMYTRSSDTLKDKWKNKCYSMLYSGVSCIYQVNAIRSYKRSYHCYWKDELEQNDVYQLQHNVHFLLHKFEASLWARWRWEEVWKRGGENRERANETWTLLFCCFCKQCWVWPFTGRFGPLKA